MAVKLLEASKQQNPLAVKRTASKFAATSYLIRNEQFAQTSKIGRKQRSSPAVSRRNTISCNIN
jgi:hypothetical protein